DVKAVCSRDRRRFHGELEPRDLTWADVRPVPADHRQRRRAVVLRPPSVGRTVRAVPPNDARLVLTRLRVPRPEVRGRIRSDCPTERARVVVGDDGARDLARAKRGITGLPVPGGVESGDTGRYARGPWDAWPQLAALAVVTSRVRLGPLVAATAFHAPGVIARMAASIDEISGGRFTLGLGAGWNEPEFRAFGFPFDRTVSRFAESF